MQPDVRPHVPVRGAALTNRSEMHIALHFRCVRPSS